MKSLKTGFSACIGLVFICAGVPAVSGAITQGSEAGHPGNFGVGAILGAPTGFSAKYWATEMLAFDGAAAWHFSDDSRFQIHSDALWHFMIPNMKVSEGILPGYLGLGLRVLAGDHPEAGIRIPVGLSYLFGSAPLEAFAEIAPVARFAPDSGIGLDGGVGLRFYFVRQK
jgi:hypothetical protein